MTTCLVCNSTTKILGKVEFNKSCGDIKKKVLPKSKILVEYTECNNCGFIFAPEICNWPKEKFEKLIYNKDYIKVDPEYRNKRPLATAATIYHMFGNLPISILDYGGGNGHTSNLLIANGMNCETYDPFYNTLPNKKYDLILAIEVIEHHPNPNLLIKELQQICSNKTVIAFTTLVSDCVVDPLKWWYTSPRNGHIALYTSKSLQLLFDKLDFIVYKGNDDSIEEGTYFAYNYIPSWLKNGCKL